MESHTSNQEFFMSSHRDELNAARELRAQQDRAYQESLEQDRQRQREQQALRDAENREVERKELIKRQKVDFASRIPEEPATSAPGVFSLNVTLPGGQRLIRRFTPDQQLAVSLTAG